MLAYTWYADVNSAGNSSGLDHALDDSVIFIEGTLHSDPIKTDPERDITYRLSKTIEMGYQYKRKNLDGKKGLLWNHVEQGTAHGTITVPKSKARKNDFYKTDFKLRINPRKLLVVNKTYYVRELVADLASKNMEEWKNLVNPNREVASFIVIDPFEGEED